MALPLGVPVVELSIHRADCLEINLRGVEQAAARLVEGNGCRWCLANALLVEFTDYARLRHPPAEITTAFTDRLDAILATEPPKTTTCRACQALRRRGKCAHGLCAEHSS